MPFAFSPAGRPRWDEQSRKPVNEGAPHRSVSDGEPAIFRVVRAEEGWEEVLTQWGVRLIFLEKDAPVVQHLDEAGWTLLYADEQAVIYAR